MNHIESTTERWQESVGEDILIHACLLMQTTDPSICLPDGILGTVLVGISFLSTSPSSPLNICLVHI